MPLYFVKLDSEGNPDFSVWSGPYRSDVPSKWLAPQSSPDCEVKDDVATEKRFPSARHFRSTALATFAARPFCPLPRVFEFAPAYVDDERGTPVPGFGPNPFQVAATTPDFPFFRSDWRFESDGSQLPRHRILFRADGRNYATDANRQPVGKSDYHAFTEWRITDSIGSEWTAYVAYAGWDGAHPLVAADNRSVHVLPREYNWEPLDVSDVWLWYEPPVPDARSCPGSTPNSYDQPSYDIVDFANTDVPVTYNNAIPQPGGNVLYGPLPGSVTVQRSVLYETWTIWEGFRFEVTPAQGGFFSVFLEILQTAVPSRCFGAVWQTLGGLDNVRIEWRKGAQLVPPPPFFTILDIIEVEFVYSSRSSGDGQGIPGPDNALRVNGGTWYGSTDPTDFQCLRSLARGSPLTLLYRWSYLQLPGIINAVDMPTMWDLD